jgi:hypothetical protein
VAVPPSVRVSETVNVYEPFASPLYVAPACDPFAPKATGGSQAADEGVGPESAQTSVAVAAGFLL